MFADISMLEVNSPYSQQQMLLKAQVRPQRNGGSYVTSR